jgi:hypothetical protein
MAAITGLALGPAAPAAAQGTSPSPSPNVDRLIERAQQRVDDALTRVADARERAFTAQSQREVQRRRRQVTQERQRERARVRQGLVQDRRERRRQGPGVTETLSRTLRLGRNGTLDLTNLSGDVRITGSRGDDLRIDAVKRIWNANEAEAKAQLQELQVRIVERGGVVEVRTDAPRRQDFVGAVDYTVSVPATATIVLRVISGDVTITNIRGEVRADTISGNITASSLGPRSTIKAVSGDIDVSSTDGAELTASTVSGALTLRGLTIRTLDLSSVSGLVRADVASERVRVRSISGRIEYAGPLARNGRYEIQSHSGDVLVTPGDEVGFEVDATTFSGDIRSDVALTLRDTREGPRGGRGSRRVVGSVGDASALLSLRSFSGDILIGR